ncbi:MAG: dTDP-4-dehydrorhamnose 3,5-epimerase [Hyphomicrobium sp.]|uniref:dTDP-4-dehydrorhamnose 3,5-epimerase n=1 Tax=Hyphomicrobium sp. TaxID=82 RepID=UPI0039E35E2A
MVRVTQLDIQDILLVAPSRYPDTRGYFTELYSAKALEEAGIRDVFVQDNLSLSTKVGTVRGLHFQAPPHSQAKLVRVSRGRVLDVALDLRTSSPSYGRHVAVELSADNGHQVYIPSGFAHGFCTLEPDTEVVYKVSDYYAPSAEGGILWSDPDLDIRWPVRRENATVSDKDAVLPLLKDLASVF